VAGILLDTSVYISALRQGDSSILTKNPDDYQLIAEFRPVAWQRI
jgi:predicted nucleic acid-binding protein